MARAVAFSNFGLRACFTMGIMDVKSKIYILEVFEMEVKEEKKDKLMYVKSLSNFLGESAPEFAAECFEEMAKRVRRYEKWNSRHRFKKMVDSLIDVISAIGVLAEYYGIDDMDDEDLFTKKQAELLEIVLDL